MQQPTKKLSNPDYFQVLENIKEDWVINSNAKIAIRKRTKRIAKGQKVGNISPKGIKQKETSQLLTEESSDAGSGFENSKENRSREEEKN